MNSLSPGSWKNANSALVTSQSPKSVADIAQRVKKVVRFQNGGYATEFIFNGLKPASEMSFNEKSLIWWQESDYCMFKKKAKMIAKEMRRQNSHECSSSSYYSILKRSFSVCCQTAEESKNDFSMSERDRRALEGHVEHGICTRGLERWTVPELALEREKRKAVAISCVIEVQDRFIKLINLDSDAGSDFIRMSSERMTR